MRIRPATSADIPAMMALERHAATAAHWSQPDYEAMLAPPAGTEFRRVALVIEEDTVEAFIVARALGREWEIENVAVSGPARRRGLGTRLLGELLDLARAEKAQSVALEVRESNLSARALYQKWAFVEDGRRPGYYFNPSEDAIVYRFSFPNSAPKLRH